MKKIFFVIFIFSTFLNGMKPPKKRQKTEVELPIASEVKKLFKQMSEAFDQIPNTTTSSIMNDNLHILRDQLDELVTCVGQLQRKDISDGKKLTR